MARVPATVVIGGGILGLSTAYSLALADSELRCRTGSTKGASPAQVFVVEQAAAICSGASGQCEGALGEFGFPAETQPLAGISFKLFAQLAQKMRDGGGSPRYSKMKVHTVFSGQYDPSHPRLPFPVEREEDVAELPSWLRLRQSWKAGLIDDGTAAARLDPPKFLSLLQQQCEQLGVRFFVNSTAIQVHQSPCTSAGLSAVDVLTRSSAGEDQTLRRIPCRALVIAAGSWSTGVLSSLFPDNSVNIPMADRQPVQTWLRLSSSTEPRHDCEQVWFSPLEENVDLHASTSIDGEMFAAGRIESAAFPPPLPQFVRPTQDEVAKLSTQVFDYVNPSEQRNVVQSGRAYMPRTAHKKPVMARVPWPLLLSGVAHEDVAQSDDLGGVFLNFGHDLDGFTLGLGSGKVMAQLILGQETSVDLSPFGLPK